MEKLRKKRFVPKAVSYHLGVAICLIKFPKETLKIKFDDGEEQNEKFLLTLFANAQYYGGGYRSASPAKVDDGMMDVITVKNVSRRVFVSNVSADTFCYSEHGRRYCFELLFSRTGKRR